MPSEWIKVTEVGRGAIHINAQQVSSFQKLDGSKYTTVWFLAGHEDGRITVEETPEQILDAITHVQMQLACRRE